MKNINFDCRASLQQSPILKELPWDCKIIVRIFQSYHHHLANLWHVYGI